MALLAALFFVLVLGAADGDGGGASWGMQVALAALVFGQMVASSLMKILERRWAEEDRARMAREVQASAERVADVARETKKDVVKILDQQTSMLSENTELTRRNGEQEQKIAASLAQFDCWLERNGAAAAAAPRETPHEGSTGGTEAADRPPC